MKLVKVGVVKAGKRVVSKRQREAYIVSEYRAPRHFRIAVTRKGRHDQESVQRVYQNPMG
jgi:hypothetical protein